MSQFLHDNDDDYAKAFIAIHRVFSENCQAKNVQPSSVCADCEGSPGLILFADALRPLFTQNFIYLRSSLIFHNDVLK